MKSGICLINTIKCNQKAVFLGSYVEKEHTSLNFGPLYIALAAFLWTTDAFVRGNLKYLPFPLTANQVVLMEHTIVVVAISPLIWKYAQYLRGFTGKEWGALLFIGIGGSALASIFLTKGFFLGDFPYQYAAVIVLLQQAQPIIAIGLAHIMLKERLPNYYYVLASVAVIGVILVILPIPQTPTYSITANISYAFTTINSNFLGNLGMQASMFGLIAAFFWGGSTAFGRYLLNHSPTKIEYIQMTTYRYFIAFLFLVLFTYFTDGFPHVVQLANPIAAGSLLYMALIVGLASLALYYYGLRTTHASVSAIFELAYPLSFFLIVPLINQVLSTNIYIPPLQAIGAVLLIASATLLSYTYGRLEQVPSTQTTTA